MKIEVKFNTISGQERVVYERSELIDTDLLRIFDSLAAQRDSGVVGATYNLPQYPSQIEVAIID